MENYYIFCACGCGRKLLKYHPIHKYQREYTRGHAFKGKKQTPEHREKIINSLKGKYFSWKGVKQSPEHIKNRVDSFRSKHHKFHHTQATKDKIAAFQKGRKKSQGMVDRLTRFAKARGKVSFKYGHFYSNKNGKKMFYRSSYELQAYNILEQLDVVERYIYEPFSINYEFNGKVYIYHPDLLVIDKTGGKQLIEVKPKGELDDPVNIQKFEGARKFCLKEGINFSIWTEDTLFASTKKVANSEKPLLKGEVTPNQASEETSLGVRREQGQPPKGMICSDTPAKVGDYS